MCWAQPRDDTREAKSAHALVALRRKVSAKEWVGRLCYSGRSMLRPYGEGGAGFSGEAGGRRERAKQQRSRMSDGEGMWGL